MTSILPVFGLKLVRVGDGGAAANGLCRSIKKQPLIPSMGQELHSCDTTQIDVLQRPLASRAITRARWITGGSPSASTWASIQDPRSSRPRKSIRPAAPRPDLTTRDSLWVCRTGYSSFSKVYRCLIVGIIIAAPRLLVNPPLEKILWELSTSYPSIRIMGAFSPQVKRPQTRSDKKFAALLEITQIIHQRHQGYCQTCKHRD